MTIAAACLNENQLNKLIDGSLPEIETVQLADHVEGCVTCQQALLTLASGEFDIDGLVGKIDPLDPPSQSAFWAVVTGIDPQRENSVDPASAEELHSVVRSLAVTQSPEEVEAALQTAAKSLARDGLEFLLPSDDPAYIGKLDHFLVARILGRGGMGVVLEAFDTHLRRNVAIKVLNTKFQDQDAARQRFCREGRAAASISHEHVVAMHHVAKASDGIAYLVMQLVEGETLDDRLKRNRLLPPDQVARIGMQIAAGLSAAHARDMIHRDIKPSNILIEAESERVKLTDFGLARVSRDIKLTQTGMVLGTPLYMAPEQAMGESTDSRSDLFSLGAVMYEMATGTAPFMAATSVGVMKRIMDEQPRPPHKVNTNVPKPLSDLIMSLLEKKPENRPESSAATATALASIVSSFGPISPLHLPAVAVNEIKKTSGSYRRVQRRWTMAAWTAAAAGILIAAATYFAMRPDGGDRFPSVVLSDNPGTVWSVDFSPGGDEIAAAVEDGSVRIWNVADQKLLKSFNAHRGIVWTVAWHPTRPVVMTSGDDSTIKLWDSTNFELLKEWKAPSAVRSSGFSPTGNRIVAGDRDGTIHVYDIDSGAEIVSQTHPGSILGVDWSADGKLIASGGSDKVVRIFDAETLSERLSLVGHDGPIYNVAFAPQGPLLASVGWNRNIRVWNVETGIQAMNLTGSEGDVWGVSFCTDGSHLVTGEQMGAARVWNLSNGKPVTTLRGHSSAVHNVSLDPNNHRIATSSRDGTIRIWDMTSVAEQK